MRLAHEYSKAYLPGKERSFLDDRRLNDLLTREDSPSDSISSVFVMQVGQELSLHGLQ